MALTTRRQLIHEAAVAAATVYGSPIKTLEALFEGSEQNAAALDSASVRRLAFEISGQVITPEAPQYESARLVFNRAFDLRPALIVRCSSASDVARTLDVGQKHNLPVAVHGGGHSRLGYGMCDGGVVIDLSAMKRVEVDAAKRVARAEAGALVRE